MQDVERDIPLAPLTTLRLGGPAESLVRIDEERDLIAAAREIDRSGEPLFILAGGSNVVIADEGVPGPVLHVATRGVERSERADGRVALTVQAGEDWDGIVQLAVEEGLAGIECLSGVPGSTGATPIQNVGAYGQDVAQTIASVRVLERSSGEVLELTPAECGFAYRTSRFKHRDTHVVLAVTFALRPGAAALSEPVRYAELALALGMELGQQAPLAAVREAVLELRRRKGMVVDPADPSSVSAGSFFTNPVLDAATADRLMRTAAQRFGPGAVPPAWAQPDGSVKVSAAWLIEQSGFVRGYGEGNVGLSTKHTLALINRGGATTAELVALAREIAAGVRDAFGIEISPEPVFVGHDW